MSPQREKVHEGRIHKPRKKAEPVTPNYRIGGRTFACEGCKNGHRVSKCTHALERPVLMTNDPGRPSSDQKRHCYCPKTCSCTKENCKCDRDCTCTRKMYMLVRVPVLGPNDYEWQVSRELTTDLKGNELSQDEIRRRHLQRTLQQPDRSSWGSSADTGTSSPPSQSSMTTSAIPAGSGFGSPTPVVRDFHTSTLPKSNCCQHRKNIEEHKPSVPEVEHAETVRTEQEDCGMPVHTKRVQCSCGPGCTCAFCYDHPNNATSQRIAHEQALYYGGLRPMQDDPNQFQTLEEMNSCMGTSPQIGWFDTPHPSAVDIKNMFGIEDMASSSGSYFLSYPVKGFSQAAFQEPAADNDPQQLEFPVQMGANFGDPGFSQQNIVHQEGMIAATHGLCDTNHAAMQQPMLQQDESHPDILPSLNYVSPSTPGTTAFYTNPWVGDASVAGVYGDWAATTDIASNWPSASTYDLSYMPSNVASQEGTIPSAVSTNILPMTANPGLSGADIPPPAQMPPPSGFHGTHGQHNDPLIGQDPRYNINSSASMPRGSLASTTTASNSLYSGDNFIHSPDSVNRPEDSG